jgi:DNA-binding NarL/FixJ family response regulator
MFGVDAGGASGDLGGSRERAGKRDTTEMLKRRVLLVEDHPMFRRGMRRLLEESGRFQVVGEAENGHEAIHLADVHHPDLIVVDVQLPGVTGLKIARVLRKQHQNAKIVFLTMHLDDERLFDAIRAGASAFLTKDVDTETLLDALRRVMLGENLINQLILSRPTLAWRVLSEFRALSHDATDEAAKETAFAALPLSAREIEVLDCVAQGLSNKEIADELYVTEQTVKNHMTSVLRKLDVNDRVQAVLFAVKNGWIEIGPQPYAAVEVPQSA